MVMIYDRLAYSKK